MPLGLAFCKVNCLDAENFAQNSIVVKEMGNFGLSKPDDPGYQVMVLQMREAVSKYLQVQQLSS